ncbi:response regulator [Halomonas sp. GXIMD04776]|uniref:response regulator n=1 Tax=Halomonas sp. GXIMD04776 TaxID=3415605 RepID=UPI003CC0B33F
MHTLLIADDHPLFREAMVNAIGSALPGSRILEAGSLQEALQRAKAHEELDLLLLDLSLPDAQGLAGLAELRERLPWLPVAIISAQQSRATVLEALSLGAVGYIGKSTPRPELLSALQRMLEGDVYLPPAILRRPQSPPEINAVSDVALEQALALLTHKQLQVLERMIQGESNKMIARRLEIAETTVKTHVSAILRKLGVNSRVQAILVAREVDLIAHLARQQRSGGI